jgi:metacaspase-1
MRSRLVVVTLLFTAALMGVDVRAGASQRALLVGVGDVKGFPLPGIDVDMDNMRKTALLMGFKPDEIKVLFDEQATLANVTAALNGWVRDGVGASDHVLIYFSGHGTRVPDAQSKDGVDDALVMHDAGFVQGRIQNVLLGRVLGAAIAKNPSHDVLVLVDACHSGSATRDLQLDNLSLGTSKAVKRFFSYPGMPAAPAAGGKRTLALTRDIDATAHAENYAALSAAGDNETATGTEQGGMFTLGLVGEIQDDARGGRQPTVEDLRAAAAKYISGHLPPQDASHPVADGNQNLIRGELQLLPLRDGQGPTWQALVALAGNRQPIKLSVGSGHEIHVGELLTVQVEVPRAGYLNVVTVDSQDRATVLYPNKFNETNAVQSGTFRFPTAQMNFLLRAREPTGPTLVVAFLTDKNINLLDLGVEGRNAAGKMQDVFTEVNGRGARALAIEAKEEEISAGSATVRVEPAAVH